MKMRVQKRLQVVEGLGHAHEVSIPDGPERTAICVVPLPGGNDETLAVDVLNALDKRKWSNSISAQKLNPSRSALLWVRSAEIRNIYIPNADWMNERQFQFANELSRLCTVWLLFPQSAADLLPSNLTTTLLAESDLLASTELTVFNSDSAFSSEWDGYPEPPSCGALEFRGTCKEVLTSSQLGCVDDAMRAGAAIMKRMIARGGGAQDLLSEIEVNSINRWTELSMIYGAQIAALMHGWRLRFDRERWEASREGGAVFEERELQILSSLYDPFLSAMYVLMRAGNLSISDVGKLRPADVAPDGARLTHNDLTFAIPKEMSMAIRALLHQQAATHGVEGPLFRTRNGGPMRASAIRQRLETFCSKTALPRPSGMLIRRPAADDDSAIELRELQMKAAA